MICRAVMPLPMRLWLALFVTATSLGVWASSRSSILTIQGPAPTEVRVHAGKHGRRQTPVRVSLPPLQRTTQHFELRDQEGVVLPVQLDAAGNAWFVLPALDAQAEAVYKVTVRDTPFTHTAIAEAKGNDISITISGKPALTYIGGAGQLPSSDIKPAFQRGGYIHPVRTPSGLIVTDDYPADHRHQHGVMFAWTSAQFEGRKTDFWNMGNVLGRVETVAVDATWSGAVHAGWKSRHRYVDLTSGAPKPVLDEEWTTRVYTLGQGPQAGHVFDVDIHQTPATVTPLVLPEYHYGGMAVRGAASFMGAPTNEIVLTSEGKDRTTADNARARWAHISGQIAGRTAGIAMLGHPDNFRAPEPMRVHPVDPYICFAPSRLGGWSITKEQPYSARYRFVAADGPSAREMLDRLWNDFADPPKVSVK